MIEINGKVREKKYEKEIRSERKQREKTDRETVRDGEQRETKSES